MSWRYGANLHKISSAIGIQHEVGHTRDVLVLTFSKSILRLYILFTTTGHWFPTFSKLQGLNILQGKEAGGKWTETRDVRTSELHITMHSQCYITMDDKQLLWLLKAEFGNYPN